MIWNNEAPKATGAYRWRESERGRVHSVRLTFKSGKVTGTCKTMPIEKVLAAAGQWSLKAAEESVDPLDGILAETQ